MKRKVLTSMLAVMLTLQPCGTALAEELPGEDQQNALVSEIADEEYQTVETVPETESGVEYEVQAVSETDDDDDDFDDFDDDFDDDDDYDYDDDDDWDDWEDWDDDYYCGDDLTFTLDEDGTLTISGTGEMWDDPDFDTGDTIEITKVIMNNGITSIGDNAFFYCKYLTSVSIPSSVKRIGEEAFDSCSSLTEVVMAEGVKEIDRCAFAYCSSLTEITLPDSVRTLESGVFQECSSLKKIKLSENLTELEDGVFENCTSLESLSIPAKVSWIGTEGFMTCESLQEIQVASGNPYYMSEDGVLFDKNKTCLIYYPQAKPDTSYAIPDSVTSFEGCAIYGCNNLQSVTIPDSVTEIAMGLFGDCPNLSSVQIPATTTAIWDGAFIGCTSLTEITLPLRTRYIGYDAFAGCTNLKKATINNSNVSIGYEAFYDCPSLTIYGYADSTAETYADANDIPFVPFEESHEHVYEQNLCTVCGAVERLTAPAMKSVSQAANGVSIKWDKSANASMYCVFRKNGSGEYIPLATVSTTTYVDTMAQSGVTYTYSVRCVAAGDGESYASGYATGKNITYLAQPSNLKASSAGYNSVKVTWSKVSGATAYVVYRKNGSSWKSLKKVTTNSYTDTGLTTGTSYTYTVRAYKSSIYSTINTTGVSASPVPAAVKLTSISRNGSSITIKWNKVDGASGYYIYRKVPGGSWSSIKTVGSSVTSYTNTGLKPGSYTYTVRAYRTVSKKNISGALNSTGKSINYNPDAPKLSSVTVAKGSVTVKWAKVANATGYLVYRKTAGAGWQLISTITKNTTVSYKDTKAVKGKTYYYTVRAYTTTGNTKVYSSYNTTGLKAVAK